MAIDDIKPPAHRPLDTFAETPVVPAKAEGFDEAAVQASQTPDAAPQPTGVVSQFTRATLSDPAQLKSAIQAVASELIDQSSTEKLSTSGKNDLVGFMSEDPVFRHEIESYLRKVIP